ncbi:MAG: adenosylmethionine decarboxylase [Candidatus Latescibacterota bacterium]|nr:MAG: adenosylmethionine decarboxylase [Candidatus Latescibacterota bacterium]
MRPLGSQLIAEFINCDADVLNDKNALGEILVGGIKECGMTLVTFNSHQFDPVGVTVLAVIGESHVVVHTYPEAHHASIDIFTCSDGPTSRTDLLEYLEKHLKPVTMRVVDLDRGNPLEVKQKDWLTSFSSCGYETRYHVKKFLFAKRSKYQQIDIIENDSFGRMLFLDRDLQISEKDAHLYNASLVAPIVKDNIPLTRVAILGGGDGGVLSELLKHGPESVVLVDIDEEVIRASKQYLKSICGESFDQPNVEVRIEDANDYLAREDGFDAIIYDLTMFPEALTCKERTAFLTGIFSKISRSLNPGGLVSMQCCSEFDTQTKELLCEILSNYFADVVFETTFIPSFCEKWVFATAKVTQHTEPDSADLARLPDRDLSRT